MNEFEIEAVEAPDFQVRDEGTVVLIGPRSDMAALWAEAFLDNAETQKWGVDFAVEPRMADAILVGIVACGLTVGP